MISIAPPETQPQILAPQIHSPEAQISETTAPAVATIFRSKFPDIPISNHLPLHTYCFEKLSELSDAPCLINNVSGKIYSFAETHLQCRKTAAAFSKLGVKQGDCVMVLLHNCPEFVFTFFGCSILGAMTTMANPFYTPMEISKQFKASGAKLIVTLSTFVDKLRSESLPAVGGDELTVLTIDAPAAPDCLSFADVVAAADEEAVPRVDIKPDDTVALPFSSGTTGLPKGVILTHKSLITSVGQQVDGENPNLYLSVADVGLCVLPLFHIFALNSVLLCCLRAGAATMLMPKFEIVAMLEGIQRHRVTLAAVVPPLVLALAKSALVEKYDLSSIRLILSGAAPLGKELEETLRTRVPQAIFGQGYGMTEAGPVLSMCPAFAKQPIPAKSGSCGIVVRNAELKVVDPDSGFSLARNLPGEICIRGPQIMKGYLNDPDATARTIDAQGWLHTGDIGYVDDDDEVFIVDRVKELIKFKGFQVAPAELESLLLSHPSIVDAAVIPQKDEVAGEVPVAFVVLAAHADLTEDALKEFIAKQVVFYKRLHKVYFTQGIPKSASGKILRKDLRDKLQSVVVAASS